MNHCILGTTLPVFELQLQPGESVVAVSGELSWMSRSIQLRTGAQFGGGGLLGAFKPVELDGEVVTYDLQAGETMRVHSGHVGMFSFWPQPTSSAKLTNALD